MPLVRPLPPLSPSSDKSHHKSPAGFQNPWPSYPDRGPTIGELWSRRFGGNKPPYQTVPSDRAELVQVLKPDFSPPPPGRTFKATWIGHASFLIQCAIPSSSRTLNILLDPVFSERTSPFAFFGPKRYTPTPCTLSELLDSIPIDMVLISHNHYDHADTSTLKTIYAHRGRNIVFCVALGNSRWLLPLGIPKQQIWEADWWDQVDVSLQEREMAGGKATSVRTSMSSGSPTPVVRIISTPCQHSSARSPFDRDHDLWCSFVIVVTSNSSQETPKAPDTRTAIYFSGDTGYRSIPDTPDPYPDSDLSLLPVCPGFAEIGKQLGPIDLALLPIGLCHPRSFMSPVHCNSADSMCVHRDVKAKRSVGMHYGTVRGGISEHYEDVRVPPREWREEAEKRGLKWRQKDSEDWEVGLMDVGESIIV